jgi:hypothetical protein
MFRIVMVMSSCKLAELLEGFGGNLSSIAVLRVSCELNCQTVRWQGTHSIRCCVVALQPQCAYCFREWKQQMQ